MNFYRPQVVPEKFLNVLSANFAKKKISQKHFATQRIKVKQTQRTHNYYFVFILKETISFFVIHESFSPFKGTREKKTFSFCRIFPLSLSHEQHMSSLDEGLKIYPN